MVLGANVSMNVFVKQLLMDAAIVLLLHLEKGPANVAIVEESVAASVPLPIVEVVASVAQDADAKPILKKMMENAIVESIVFVKLLMEAKVATASVHPPLVEVVASVVQDADAKLILLRVMRNAIVSASTRVYAEQDVAKAVTAFAVSNQFLIRDVVAKLLLLDVAILLSASVNVKLLVRTAAKVMLDGKVPATASVLLLNVEVVASVAQDANAKLILLKVMRNANVDVSANLKFQENANAPENVNAHPVLIKVLDVAIASVVTALASAAKLMVEMKFPATANVLLPHVEMVVSAV